jgi:hypothetical protein
MSIAEIVQRRGIKHILHYTTNHGLLGMLGTGRCLPSNKLSQEYLLSHILKRECPDRTRDKEWHGHVNLSIGGINAGLFNIANDKWHADFKTEGWWCILSFSPAILEHAGVYFTTTNNIYTSVVRGQGELGLESLFAGRIVRYKRNIVLRPADMEAFRPTCHQAEVLYPGDLSLRHLDCVFVSKEEHEDHIRGMLAALQATAGLPLDLPVIVDPLKFKK